MSDAEKHASMFAGRWIGETQGCESPAHVWQIAQHGRQLAIEMRWEHETRGGHMFGEALADEPAFTLGDRKAVLVDSQHFIIRGWDTNDVRNHAGPAYDVVFSRPGIAELNAHAVWQAYLADRPQTRDDQETY